MSEASPRETMWDTNGKARGAGLLKSIGIYIMTKCAPDDGHSAAGFSVGPGGFQYCFGQTVHCYFPIPPF